MAVESMGISGIENFTDLRLNLIKTKIFLVNVYNRLLIEGTPNISCRTFAAAGSGLIISINSSL
ncbi:TPA: hypothetical protein ROX86_003103 [Bacillus thuringiensis]|nr:hypothetical protein [Bacillus thuringiensis]